MIDKSLVKRRFKRSLETYNDNAIVQKQMADYLIKLLKRKDFDKVFEIGCSAGVLTELIVKNIKYKEITVNDIVPESKMYIDNILSDYTFSSGDIETVNINKKYDLIISNACLQWCNDFENIIKKLYLSLNDNGILAFSIFGDSNLKELKDVFDIREKAYSTTEFKQILKDYKNCIIKENTVKLYFENLREILQHLKYTGANSVKEYTLTKSALKKYEELYVQNYSQNGKLVLTYNPVYVVISL